VVRINARNQDKIVLNEIDIEDVDEFTYFEAKVCNLPGFHHRSWTFYWWWPCSWNLLCSVTSQQKQLEMHLIFIFDTSHLRGLNSGFRFLKAPHAHCTFLILISDPWHIHCTDFNEHGFPLMRGQAQNVWKQYPKYGTWFFLLTTFMQGRRWYERPEEPTIQSERCIHQIEEHVGFQ